VADMLKKELKIKPRKNPLVFENLEPRLLLSADVAALSELARESLQPVVHEQVVASPSSEEVAQTQDVGLFEVSDQNVLYVIDSSLQDVDVLVAGLQQQHTQPLQVLTPETDLTVLRDTKQDQANVFILNGEENGLSQLESLLEHMQNVDAVHIFSHGASGQIHLGNQQLSLSNIDSFQQSLQQLGQSLSVEADILFYACDVTSSQQGTVLIQKIAEYTQADVAASNNKTGNTPFADWILETHIGTIESQSISFANYQSI
jgi:hypothetical protein